MFDVAIIGAGVVGALTARELTRYKLSVCLLEKSGLELTENPDFNGTREDTMVSVKTASPIPKDKIFEVMRLIRAKSVCAPVKIGDVIIEGVFGTDVVATKNIG